MKDELNINVSEIYSVLKELTASKKLELYDEDAINHKIISCNNTIYKQFGKLSEYTQSLIEARRVNDVKMIKENLKNIQTLMINMTAEFDILEEYIRDLMGSLPLAQAH